MHKKVSRFPKTRIACSVNDAGWYDRADKGLWWYSKNIKSPARYAAIFGPGSSELHRLAYLELHELLLKVGGEETCFAYKEPDLKNIVGRGYYRPGKPAIFSHGVANGCHLNCARIYQHSFKRERLRLCTGYALSCDGIWRQHTWLVETWGEKEAVIETTELRMAYFGFDLTRDEAEAFCLQQESIHW